MFILPFAETALLTPGITIFFSTEYLILFFFLKRPTFFLPITFFCFWKKNLTIYVQTVGDDGVHLFDMNDETRLDKTSFVFTHYEIILRPSSTKVMLGKRVHTCVKFIGNIIEKSFIK